jgi:uncharacterized RDD family membrane protein YckC
MDENQVVEQDLAKNEPEMKADLGKRAVALIIDGVIAGILGLVPLIGMLAGAAYMLFRDGFEFSFMDHRSLGKKVMKLRPVRLDEGTVDLGTSFKRNWIFAVPLVIFVIPFLGVLAPIISIAVAIIEIVLVVTRDDGRRWGDQMAGTRVIEVTE